MGFYVREKKNVHTLNNRVLEGYGSLVMWFYQFGNIVLPVCNTVLPVCNTVLPVCNLVLPVWYNGFTGL